MPNFFSGFAVVFPLTRVHPGRGFFLQASPKGRPFRSEINFYPGALSQNWKPSVGVLNVAGFVDDVKEHHLCRLQVTARLKVIVRLVLNVEVTRLRHHSDEEHLIVEIFGRDKRRLALGYLRRECLCPFVIGIANLLNRNAEV